MIRRKRVLYHRIHPFKLLTDCLTAIFASVLFWKSHIILALLIGLVPSIGVTLLFLSGAMDTQLEKLRLTPLGRTIPLNLTTQINALRFAGLAIAWTGCAMRIIGFIVFGAALIGVAWYIAWQKGMRMQSSIRSMLR